MPRSASNHAPAKSRACSTSSSSSRTTIRSCSMNQMPSRERSKLLTGISTWLHSRIMNYRLNYRSSCILTRSSRLSLIGDRRLKRFVTALMQQCVDLRERSKIAARHVKQSRNRHSSRLSAIVMWATSVNRQTMVVWLWHPHLVTTTTMHRGHRRCVQKAQKQGTDKSCLNSKKQQIRQ